MIPSALKVVRLICSYGFIIVGFLSGNRGYGDPRNLGPGATAINSQDVERQLQKMLITKSTFDIDGSQEKIHMLNFETYVSYLEEIGVITAMSNGKCPLLYTVTIDCRYVLGVIKLRRRRIIV
jgi:hypothetical protein